MAHSTSESTEQIRWIRAIISLTSFLEIFGLTQKSTRERRTRFTVILLTGTYKTRGRQVEDLRWTMVFDFPTLRGSSKTTEELRFSIQASTTARTHHANTYHRLLTDHV